MEKKDKEFLPIGTVVLLENGQKKVMITGYGSADQENKDVIFDYSGCLYPEGFLSYNQVGLFNHNQIKEVIHMGYVDDEEKSFQKVLNIILKVQKEIIENGDISFDDVNEKIDNNNNSN